MTLFSSEFRVAFVALLIAGAPLSPAPAEWTRQTEHFDLYIESGDPDEYARMLEQKMSPRAALEKVNGAETPRLNIEYLRWLTAHQILFGVQRGEWSSWNGVVSGDSDNSPISDYAMARAPLRKISVLVESVDGQGGLAICGPGQTWFAAEVNAAGTIELQQFRANKWEPVGASYIPKRELGQPISLSLTCNDAKHAVLVANDRELMTIKLDDKDARFGLCSNRGKAVFSKIECERRDSE